MLPHKTKLLRLLQFQQIVKFSSVSTQCKERKLRVLDLDINYIETLGGSKNAHPIFFLPGLLGSIEMNFKPILHELNQQKYKWIAWDPPGHGKSRPPSRPYRPKGYECGYEFDVKYAAELMKVLGFEKYTVLAWSGGSVTGVMMASQTPELVSSLITWGAFGFLGPDAISVLKGFKKFGINALPSLRRAQLVEMYGEEILRKMWDAVTDELIQVSKSDKYKKNGKYQDILKNVQCPTFIIHGLKDPMFGVPYAHHLNSIIKNSRLHIMENGTHNLHLRETKEFVNCIENFMDTVVLKLKTVSKL